MLAGRVPTEVCPLLYGASLCALKKKDGDIRPIAVGFTLRRLASKLGCWGIKDRIGHYLRPVQVRFGTPGGAEAAAHAARRHVNSPHETPKVLLKADFINAFNKVSRDRHLRLCKEKLPELYSFLHQCYWFPSNLAFGDEVIPSLRRVQ